MSEAHRPEGVRLDRWLWAARFFKTRSLAVEAIAGGKVQVNGHRAKRAKLLRIGDELVIRKGPFQYCVTVRTVAARRCPVREAQALYQETTESILRREALAAQLKSTPTPVFRTKGRPTKKERRDIDRLKRSRGF